MSARSQVTNAAFGLLFSAISLATSIGLGVLGVDWYVSIVAGAVVIVALLTAYERHLKPDRDRRAIRSGGSPDGVSRRQRDEATPRSADRGSGRRSQL